jgi:hypothetical protein
MYSISNITFCLYFFASKHLTANRPLRSHKLVTTGLLVLELLVRNKYSFTYIYCMENVKISNFQRH